MANILNQLSTEEVKELFITLLQGNQGNISTTCEQVGISRSTYYDWVNEDEAFRVSLLEDTERKLDLAEQALMQAVMSMDIQAIRYYLDAQGKSRGYGGAGQLGISGPAGGPIPGTVDVHHYPPEPTTMREWEEQVQASRALRLAEQAEAEQRELTGTEAKLKAEQAKQDRQKSELFPCHGEGSERE